MASSLIGYVVFLGAAMVMAVALLFGLRAVKLIYFSLNGKAGVGVSNLHARFICLYLHLTRNP
jgi:hypothetical protein